MLNRVPAPRDPHAPAPRVLTDLTATVVAVETADAVAVMAVVLSGEDSGGRRSCRSQAASRTPPLVGASSS